MSDNILFTVFGVLTLIALIFGGVCIYFAVQNAKKPDSEIKMAFWSFGALAGLVFAGMCSAYFLIPIIANHLFR